MNHRQCPLCDKKVSASKIGTHLLSQTHADELCSYRPGEALCPSGSKEGYLTTIKERLADKKMIPIYTKPGMAKKMYVCFGCNTARDKDDVEHFKRHPACLELHRKRTEVFTSRQGKSVDKDTAEQVMRWRNAHDKMRRQFEEAGEELEEFKEVAAKLLASGEEDEEEISVASLTTLLESRNGKSLVKEASDWQKEREGYLAEILTLKGSLASLQEKMASQSLETLAPLAERIENFPKREVPVAAAQAPITSSATELGGRGQKTSTPPELFRFGRSWTLPWWDEDAIPNPLSNELFKEMEAYFAAKNKARAEQMLAVAASAPPIEQPAAPKIIQSAKRVFLKPKPVA